MQMKTNKNGVKLLAAIAVFAIMFAGLAVAVSDDAQAGAAKTQATPVNTDMITLEDQSTGNITGAHTGTAHYNTATNTLTLTNYVGPGFKSENAGGLNIVVHGSNQITMDRGTITSTGYSAIYVSAGNLTITDDGDGTTTDSLTITVNGCSVDDGTYAAATYGIFAKGAYSVSNIELNMTVSMTDNLAFAIQGKSGTDGDNKVLNTFTNVTGTIKGGNRAIQEEGYSTLTFNNCQMTITGGEKAIQAKNTGSTLALTNGSVIELKLSDTLVNSGVNDRFGAKLKALTVSEDSTLKTEGLRINGTGAAPEGKVYVSGGYEQGYNEVMGLAGLFFDTKVADSIVAEVGTVASAAKNKFTVSSDADTYNISVKDKTKIDAVVFDSTTAADASTSIAGILNDTAENNVQINISGTAATGSGASDKVLTLSDLKGKNVTLVLANVTNITDVVVTVKGTESFSIVTNSAVDYTFTHNTTNTVKLDDFTGTVVVTPGSVDIQINGAGTLIVTGDVKVSGTVTGNTTIQTASTATSPADVDLSGVTITSGKLTLDGINVKSSDYITNADTVAFTNDTTIDGSIFINGGSVEGTVKGGNLVVKGAVGVTSTDLTIGSDAKMNISKGCVVTLGSGTAVITNNGIINLSGTIDNSTTDAKITNANKIVYLDKDASIKDLTSDHYDMTATGIIDSSAIASDVQISGDVESATEYGLYQTVTITGNVTLIKGAQITIKGALVINEGVTVTIEDGAQLIITGPAATMENNGTIINESNAKDTDPKKAGETLANGGGLILSENSVSINNGSILLSYALLSTESGNETSMTVSAKLINNGTINVSEDNKLDNTVAIENKTDGTINIYGEIGTIKNAGTVTLDGTSGTISNVADGAIVSVISTKADVTINDTGFTYGKNTPSGTNSFAIVKGDATSVGTFTVVSEVTKTTNSNGTVTYGKKMTVAGAISETYSTGDHADVKITGTVNIADELTISEYIDLTNDATSGTLKVAGTLTAKLGTQISVGTLTVTGEVIVGTSAVSATTVNAAMYKVVVINPASTTFYYTTLDKAIAGAAEASVNEVTATGDVVVKADIGVPAGMTVKQTSGKITVGSSTATDVTMTVAQGGKINQTTGATIDVKGTLYIVDKKTGISKGATVTCEVVAEGETDLRYTNLNSAIAAAGSDPVTITLNGNTTITSDSTIPENVTIDMNGNKFAVQGAKLTINGTLYVDEVSNYTVTDVTGTVTKVGKVVLNGYIISDDPISYSASTAKSPAGVYYIADSMNIITSIENIDEAVSEADDSVVAVNGEIVAGDLTVSGTSDAPVTVNVNGKLTAGKIAVDFATIVLKQNIKVTATIAGANGSIALSSVQTVTDTKIIANENSSNVKVLTVDSGSIKSITDETETYAAVMDGDVTIKALTLDSVTDKYSLTVDGNVKVTGSSNSLKDVLVNGTLTADNAVTVYADNIDVLGTLAAEKATETKTAGSISVTKTLVVGSTAGALGAGATATGSITYTTLLVLDGATVDEAIIADMKSTAFYVEGVVWMIGYTSDISSSYTLKINSIDIIPIEDAYFGGIWRTDIADSTSNIDNNAKIGSVPAVYALITYDIYDVKVVADNGVGTISIDGIVLVKGASSAGENVFTLPSGKLKAGAHQITYTVKDGYDGTVKILVDGTAISGNTFTLSGTENIKINDDGVASVPVSINISGTTPSTPATPVEPTKDDSMGITEYLLIVLVILAAILVVVVAIRMMRS